MPEIAEAPVIAEPIGDETRDLSSPFDNVLPIDDDLREEPEKVEPQKTEKVKSEPKPVKEEKKTEVAIPDLLDFVPEKKEEVNTGKEPEPTPIPETIKGEKPRKAFADLDQLRISAEKKSVDLERRLKAAEEKAAAGDPDSKTRIATLEQQLQNADSLVQRALLQEHPQFQAKYVIPRQQLLEQAKNAFKDAGGDPSQIESAMELKGKARVDKLDELMGEVSSKILSTKLEQAVVQIERIDNERDMVLKNSAAYNKRLQDQDAVNRSRQFQELEKVTKVNLEKASKVLADQYNIALFKHFDDPKFEDWNKERNKILSVAENIMLKVENPEEMAIAAQMAAGFPRAYALFVNEHKAHLETKKRLGDYEKSEVGLGQGKTTTTSSEELDEEVPLATAIISSVKKAQGR